MSVRLEDLDEVELRNLMNDVCRGVTNVATIHGLHKPLFAVLLFNDPKVGQYASNCNRSDMIEALRDAADRLERNEDVRR